MYVAIPHGAIVTLFLKLLMLSIELYVVGKLNNIFIVHAHNDLELVFECIDSWLLV